MPTPHATVHWDAPDAAPNVRLFKAGTHTAATNAWTAAMRWDTLGENLMVDYAVILPAIRANWSAVAIWQRSPDGIGGYYEQAATGKITAEVSETNPDGLKYFEDSIGILPRFVPEIPETWEYIAVSYDAAGQPNRDIDGHVTGPTIALVTLLATTVTLTAPGPVTITSHDWRFTEVREDGNRHIEVRVYIDPPSPLNGFNQFPAWVEAPDQSAGDTFTVGVSTVGSADAVVGNWAPQPLGIFPYVAGEPVIFEFPQPNWPEEDWRIYIGSANDVATAPLVRNGETGATPSFAIHVTQYADDATGEEFASNVTGMVLIDTDTLNSDGKLKRWIEVGATPPADDRFAGVTAELYDAITGELITPNDFGPDFTAAGGIRVLWDEPNYVTRWALRLRSFSADGTNTYRQGVTPEIELQVGSETGTVDFGAAIRSTLADYFDVAEDGTFIVKNQGLTRTQLENEIIGIDQLEDAAIIKNAHIIRAGINKLLVLDADIDTLAANKITAGTLVSGVIYAGAVNASQVNAGAFSGCTLTLNLNGVTTTIANSYDAGGAQYVGLKTSYNAGTYYSLVTWAGVETRSSSTDQLTGAGLSSYGAYAAGRVWCRHPSYPSIGIEMCVGSTGNGYLSVNGTQVVTQRQTIGGGGDTLANLYTALRAHGLIT